MNRRRTRMVGVLIVTTQLLVFGMALLMVQRVDADQPAPDAVSDTMRVIVVGGALTEIVYELGAETHLVGVDTTSQHPEAATALPQVGYQRNLAAEGFCHWFRMSCW